MITSIITEENELIRHGLKNAREETEASEVIGDYASAAEMLPYLKSLQPDVVILAESEASPRDAWLATT